MSLTAIIVAQEVIATGDGSLRAGLPIAGKSLFERQAEKAIAGGVTKILVLISTLPQWLTLAIDRLSSPSVQVAPVRSATEILWHVEELDDVLLIADGLYASSHCYTSVLEAAAPALLATTDHQAASEFERIDGQTRWAGLALLPYDLVSQIQNLPSDWDITSTLLRQAVQAGASRLMRDPIIMERGDLTIIDDAMDASLVTSHMLQQADVGGGGMGQRLIFSPVSTLLGPSLLSRNIPTAGFFGIAVALASVSLIVGGFGQPLWAAVAAIFGHVAASLGSYQSIFTGSNKLIGRLKNAGFGLFSLLPVAILIPEMPHSLSDTGGISLVVLSLSLIIFWSLRDPLTRLAGGFANDADYLLFDIEMFSIALLVAGVVNFPMAAIQVSALAASAGLLIWVRQMSTKTAEADKNRPKV